jgi:hypothetical protein
MSDSSSPVRGPGKRSSLRRLSTRACLSWQRTGRGTKFAAAHALLGDRPERLFRIYLAHFAPLVSPDRVAVEISHSKASLPTGAEVAGSQRRDENRYLGAGQRAVVLDRAVTDAQFLGNADAGRGLLTLASQALRFRACRQIGSRTARTSEMGFSPIRGRTYVVITSAGWRTWSRRPGESSHSWRAPVPDRRADRDPRVLRGEYRSPPHGCYLDAESIETP